MQLEHRGQSCTTLPNASTGERKDIFILVTIIFWFPCGKMLSLQCQHDFVLCHCCYMFDSTNHAFLAFQSSPRAMEGASAGSGFVAKSGTSVDALRQSVEGKCKIITNLF